MTSATAHLSASVDNTTWCHGSASRGRAGVLKNLRRGPPAPQDLIYAATFLVIGIIGIIGIMLCVIIGIIGIIGIIIGIIM